MWYGMTIITSLLIALCHLSSLAPRTYIFVSVTVVLMCGLCYWPVLEACAFQKVTDTVVMIVFPGDRHHWIGIWFRYPLCTSTGAMDMATAEVALSKDLLPGTSFTSWKVLSWQVKIIVRKTIMTVICFTEQVTSD